jgi:lysozyme
MKMNDKVTVYVHQRPSDDSLRSAIKLADKEMDEMRYYFRSHHVADEGYNQIAAHHTRLSQRRTFLQALLTTDSHRYYSCDTIAAKDRPRIAVKTSGGYWQAGRFVVCQRLNGKGIAQDHDGRIIRGIWNDDTIIVAKRTDSLGVYFGQTNHHLKASGQGLYRSIDGNFYDGHWLDDKRQGFGFESSPHHQLRVGEWKNGRFLGERLGCCIQRRKMRGKR